MVATLGSMATFSAVLEGLEAGTISSGLSRKQSKGWSGLVSWYFAGGGGWAQLGECRHAATGHVPGVAGRLWHGEQACISPHSTYPTKAPPRVPDLACLRCVHWTKTAGDLSISAFPFRELYTTQDLGLVIFRSEKWDLLLMGSILELLLLF